MWIGGVRLVFVGGGYSRLFRCGSFWDYILVNLRKGYFGEEIIKK